MDRAVCGSLKLEELGDGFALGTFWSPRATKATIPKRCAFEAATRYRKVAEFPLKWYTLIPWTSANGVFPAVRPPCGRAADGGPLGRVP